MSARSAIACIRCSAHFSYVKARAKIAPKIYIPSPTHIATVLRDWRETVDQYPELDAVYADARPA